MPWGKKLFIELILLHIDLYPFHVIFSAMSLSFSSIYGMTDLLSFLKILSKLQDFPWILQVTRNKNTTCQTYDLISKNV